MLLNIHTLKLRGQYWYPVPHPPVSAQPIQQTNQWTISRKRQKSLWRQKSHLSTPVQVKLKFIGWTQFYVACERKPVKARFDSVQLLCVRVCVCVQYGNSRHVHTVHIIPQPCPHCFVASRERRSVLITSWAFNRHIRMVVQTEMSKIHFFFFLLLFNMC